MSLGKLKHLMIILLVCLIGSAAFAQSIVQGIIKNSATGELLPFASVTVKGSAQGTVTNEQGSFAFVVKVLPVTLTISSVGYQSTEVTVSTAASLNVQLQPYSVQLQEVTVGNAALQIMRQVAARAQRESKQTYLFKTFFRQLSSEGGEPVFFSESFMNTQWQNWSFDLYQITNSRYLEGNHWSTYNNIAPLSLACSGYVNNNLVTYPISHKPDSLYKFRIKEFFKANGREIAVISCTLRSSDYKHTAFSGDYYVDTENYTVLKTDGDLVNVRINASGPFSFKIKEIKVTSQYKPGADSSSVLDFVTFSFSSSLKAGFIGLKQLNYTTKLFTIAQDPTINQQSMQPVSMSRLQTDRDRFVGAAYDPVFWKNNAVIKRTDEENMATEKLEKFKAVKGNLDK